MRRPEDRNQPGGREAGDLRAQAPYRFVPLGSTVVETPLSDRQLANIHDVPLPNGLSAELVVRWAAETPLLIGETWEPGAGEEPDVMGPVKLGDDYVIPGASLRGMLRSVMEIACFARLMQINAHHRYGIRDFQHDFYKELLKTTAEEGVKSGWLRCANPEARPEQRRYVIRPCEWAAVAIDSFVGDLPGSVRLEDWRTMELLEKYRKLGATEGPGGRLVDWQETRRPVQRIGRNRMGVAPDGESHYLVVSGRSVNATGRFAKKVEYAFTRGADADERLVHPAAFDGFELVHSKPARNRREPEGAWEAWQPQIEAGREVPVFYVGNLDAQAKLPEEARLQAVEQLRFGLTRLFKVPSKYSVGQIRDRHPGQAWEANSRVDMVEALFGHVDEVGDRGPGSQPSARRGRIRFEFAKLVNPDAIDVTEAMDVVMMGPRASYAPFYLTNERDWSGNSGLAGRKRYPARFDQDRVSALNDIRTRFNRSTRDAAGRPIPASSRSRLRYLVGKGGEPVFEGRIRLHNVLPVELGALIWALRLGEGATKARRHALGRGKAFGCGQMRVVSIGLRVRPNLPKDPSWQKLLRTGHDWDRPEAGESWVPPQPAEREDWRSTPPFMMAFVSMMSGKVENWVRTPPIQALLASTNPARGERLRRAGKLNYLGEIGADGKAKDGHTAHSDLKRKWAEEHDQRSPAFNLPWE